MRHVLISCACATLLTVASAGAHAFTGNEVRGWYVNYSSGNGSVLPTEYLGYIAGIVDTMQNVAFCAPGSATYIQLGAVAKKYIEANPELWNQNGAGLVMTAIGAVYPCKKSKT